ncbi:formylglycine-generating enzyme family protein [Methylomonas sp. AM2-LC]|uniref:formylglycine-generating enzyme family protein n=1 Tax=Methylomonas sp. AM2-LC TaxID=3153301 RepID=UPI00326769F1
MATGAKSWGDANLVRVVLVCEILIGVLLYSITGSSAISPPLLGTPEQCTHYSGLPNDWGTHPRAGMVYINGGVFTLGTTLGYPEERNEIKTSVKGFWIDQTEVTVAQFLAFVKATGYITEAERDGGGVVFHNPDTDELNQRSYAWWKFRQGADWRHPAENDISPDPNQPVTLVTLNDALAYSKWLGRDLPTEAEWEYAAKAGLHGANLEKEPRDAKGKPLANFWQGSFPTLNNREDGYKGLAPVGCFSANEFKLYDMIGNAWEQTKDIYTESHQSRTETNLSQSREVPNQAMVVKGGSHLCGRDFCVRYRPSAREAHEANLPISHIGFRTVLREPPSDHSLLDINAW